MGVTVSGFTCGKEEISPASQIPAVDAAWRDMFPESDFDKCPMFKHSNDQYKGKGEIIGDICKFSEVPRNHKCCMVIIAGPTYDGKSIEAKRMLQEDFWNGVNHVKTTWDCTLGSAIDEYADEIKGYKPDHKEKHIIKDDWLVVTVDYHS